MPTHNTTGVAALRGALHIPFAHTTPLCVPVLRAAAVGAVGPVSVCTAASGAKAESLPIWWSGPAGRAPGATSERLCAMGDGDIGHANDIGEGGGRSEGTRKCARGSGWTSRCLEGRPQPSATTAWETAKVNWAARLAPFHYFLGARWAALPVCLVWKVACDLLGLDLLVALLLEQLLGTDALDRVRGF